LLQTLSTLSVAFDGKLAVAQPQLFPLYTPAKAYPFERHAELQIEDDMMVEL
jgi:hypothetical protein